MSAHAYPTSAVLADAARAAVGLMLVAVPLAAGGRPTWQTALFAAFAAVFVLYGLVSLRRAVSPVEAGEDGICVRGPWPARLRWAELNRLGLAYYTTRRDGSGGWMQLTLSGPGRKVVVDSRIGSFDLLVRRAADVARAKALHLDPATIVNLRGLGIAPPAPPAQRKGRL